MEKTNTKKGLYSILAVAALVLVIGATYAFITFVITGERENTITGGSLTITLDDSSDSLGNGEGDIAISDAFPVTDAVGMTKTPYTFTLENTSTKDASYTIFLDESAVDEGQTRMSDSQVKVYLTNGDGTKVYKGPTKVSELGNKVSRTVNDETVNSSVIYSSVLKAAVGNVGTKETFVLRLWISDDADATVLGKQYATKVSVDATQVPEYAVTLINGDATDTTSKAVFSSGTATFTVTKGTGIAAISCTNGVTPNALVENTTDSTKYDVTIPNVEAHTVCTITYTQ